MHAEFKIFNVSSHHHGGYLQNNFVLLKFQEGKYCVVETSIRAVVTEYKRTMCFDNEIFIPNNALCVLKQPQFLVGWIFKSKLLFLPEILYLKL